MSKEISKQIEQKAIADIKALARSNEYSIADKVRMVDKIMANVETAMQNPYTWAELREVS